MESTDYLIIFPKDSHLRTLIADALSNLKTTKNLGYDWFPVTTRKRSFGFPLPHVNAAFEEVFCNNHKKVTNLFKPLQTC